MRESVLFALGSSVRSSRRSACMLQHLRRAVGLYVPRSATQAVGLPSRSATCRGRCKPGCPWPAQAARGARPPQSCSQGARAAWPPPARSAHPAARRPGGRPPPRARRPPAACLRSSPARGSCAGCAQRGSQHDARGEPMPSRPANSIPGHKKHKTHSIRPTCANANHKQRESAAGARELQAGYASVVHADTDYV